ncbi:MAG: isoaspartyl peptidase/L-asparaginase [Burkholderiales bacterium]|nr:isoaspartyl peptidase/L-asparaginase [Burkholderiales bacterium]
MKRIIIHGGCGAREEPNTPFEAYHDNLLPIIKEAYAFLEQTNDAIETAKLAARLLEDNPIFNAGTGSRVQQDGQIRMSASYMDSIKNKFSGVINIQNVKYPSEVAYQLHKQHHSILSGEHATNHAYQKLEMCPYNPMTEKRWNEYLELKKGLTGTIGVVVLDDNGTICAITSTGGAGFEIPGRVGDSPTVAGNFASNIMGISCTGIGEEIVNKAVAAKIHTRVLDGMSLSDAVSKSINESNVTNDYVGLIAIDSNGNICTGTTTIAQTLYAYYDGSAYHTFLESI